MSRDMDTNSNSERLFIFNGGKNQTTLDIDGIRFSSRGCWAEPCQESQRGVSQEAGLSPWRQMAQGGYGHSLKILHNANRERQETAVRCQVLFGMRLLAVCSDICEYSSAAFFQRQRRSLPNRSSAWKFPPLTFLGLYNILKTGIGFLRYLCTSWVQIILI